MVKKSVSLCFHPRYSEKKTWIKKVGGGGGGGGVVVSQKGLRAVTQPWVKCYVNLYNNCCCCRVLVVWCWVLCLVAVSWCCALLWCYVMLF